MDTWIVGQNHYIIASAGGQFKPRVRFRAVLLTYPGTLTPTHGSVPAPGERLDSELLLCETFC
jgi:hypothetical protein